MYRLQKRLDEKSDEWYYVIDTKLSKLKPYPRIFFSENEVDEYIQSTGKDENLFRKVEVDD